MLVVGSSPTIAKRSGSTRICGQGVGYHHRIIMSIVRGL